MQIDEITGRIVDAAIRVHRGLGPGLLESVYEAVLARELARGGLRLERQRVLPFEYDGMSFEEGLRVDLLVEDLVVVELKSVEQLLPVHPKQVLRDVAWDAHSRFPETRIVSGAPLRALRVSA